jgi:hypothetical protein
MDVTINGFLHKFDLILKKDSSTYNIQKWQYGVDKKISNIEDNNFVLDGQGAATSGTKVILIENNGKAD